ncbi:MAG TPA: N-acetyltransferase [Acidobacteria bacterium]|nr:N-acetyltransferase [Acidobacteriota bacterium]
MPPLEVRPVRGKTDLALFIDLPWRIYRGDPNWVPPLKASVRELLDADKHPFYGGGKDAEIELFLAWEGRKVVGRVAAILNRAHNRFHGENIGFFGFFESTDRQEVAEGLMAAVEAWAMTRKLDAVRGPANPSTNYECGLLIEGFDGPPVLMMTYNPEYYPALLEESGYAKVKDLYAYISPVHGRSLDRLGRLVERTRRRHPGITTRRANLKDFRGEVQLVQEIYNDAWEKNWGFIPMSEGEINWMARELKPLVQPDLLRFAFLDGEVAGFILAVPDWNPVLKDLDGSPWKHPIRTVRHLLKSKPETMEGLRVITMGVKQKFRKRGIEGILVYESIQEALRIGYSWSEYSWILEDNELVKGTIKLMDGKLYRKYRFYEKPLG